MKNYLFISTSFFLICTGAKAESVIETDSIQTSLYETAGFLGGIFIGGLSGGPPGAIIGSGIGALMAESWNEYRESNNNLKAALNDANVSISKKDNELALFRKKYEVAQAEIDLFKRSIPPIVPAYLSASSHPDCCKNIVTSIYFRSGQSNIEPHYEEQLISMVGLLKEIANLRVEITGFADRNGNDNQNFDLSNQRANSVKSFFNEKGIENSNITTLAYGETQPLEVSQTLESDFFDRRVVVRFLSNNQSMLTRLPSDK